MGAVRGRSPLARIAARLRHGFRGRDTDYVAMYVGGSRMPTVLRGTVVEVDAPPIVPLPADQAPITPAQPAVRYPRHGFGQEWPR